MKKESIQPSISAHMQLISRAQYNYTKDEQTKNKFEVIINRRLSFMFADIARMDATLLN